MAISVYLVAMENVINPVSEKGHGTGNGDCINAGRGMTMFSAALRI